MSKTDDRSVPEIIREITDNPGLIGLTEYIVGSMVVVVRFATKRAEIDENEFRKLVAVNLVKVLKRQFAEYRPVEDNLSEVIDVTVKQLRGKNIIDEPDQEQLEQLKEIVHDKVIRVLNTVL
ncbi:hypothetical protein HGB24_03510 [Candidatus Saccharibacteria bacterium]|nr:hypothetical protein [Candidatus Saccharibacteria bacterium]